MNKFWSGFIVGWIVLAVGALIITGFGWTPLAATWMDDQGWLKTPLIFVTRQAIEASSEEVTNPFAEDPSALEEGAKEFLSHCVHCHATQENKAAEWSRGLVPQPPDVDSERMQSLSDAQMFWVIKNGIHSTGMPYFEHEEDEEIWKMVAFLSAYPDIPVQVMEVLHSGAEEHEH